MNNATANTEQIRCKGAVYPTFNSQIVKKFNKCGASTELLHALSHAVEY